MTPSDTGPLKAGPDPQYGVTRDDMDALRQRHVEAGQDRQRGADTRLCRALVLGSKLAARKG